MVKQLPDEAYSRQALKYQRGKSVLSAVVASHSFSPGLRRGTAESFLFCLFVCFLPMSSLPCCIKKRRLLRTLLFDIIRSLVLLAFAGAGTEAGFLYLYYFFRLPC